ncbi:MAG: VWA domain-containing protein [Deltaproteobacteria bacterium]|nr:VWA domain-containing protein [Deltaproteobacteria bacterium]
MVNLILRFVSCSRGAGLRASTSEVLDCFHQLQLVDVTDESQFRAVLRANFAKNLREQSKFDHLYHLFFKELREDESIAHSSVLADRMDEILKFLKKKFDEEEGFTPVLDFLAGDPFEFLQDLRRIMTEGEGQYQGIGANLGPVTRRLEVMLRLNAVRGALTQYMEKNRMRIDWEDRRDLLAHYNDRLETARDLLTRDQRVQSSGLEKVTVYDNKLGRLGEIPFISLTQREIDEMRDVVEKLVRKLKDKVSLRHSRKNSGVLDVKKTLRKSAKYNGVPIEIVFKNRPPRKGKVVTLCDVSNSVWSAAKFMLNMLYSLQECFTKVRSFVFVAGLAEVTKVFEDNEGSKAVDKALNEADIEYGAPTDYGLTFRHFKREYMDALNKKTTLIIIGDGRSNYTNPEAEILGEMKERCRRVIWLNPETKRFWYTGDSEMKTYEPYFNQLRQCQNLNQLVDFIEDLVL